MGGVSAVLAQTNHSQHTNFTQDFNSSKPYSDAEVVLLGAAMALLVLAIVFGELLMFRSNQRPAFDFGRTFTTEFSLLLSVQETCW